MKAKAQAEDLVKGLSRASAIADRRGTMPILSHVLLEVDGDGINLFATDLEVSWRGTVSAEMETPGKLAVPAPALLNMVKSFPGETVIKLEALENHSLKIMVGDADYRINGLDPDQFPPVPEIEEGGQWSISGRVLEETIRQTIYAADRGDYLNDNTRGLYWEPEAKDDLTYLRMVGTDGHRLAVKDQQSDGVERLLSQGVVVPLKGVIEIGKMAKEVGDVALNINLNENTMAVKGWDSILYVRLLSKRFPDYRRIIPEKYQTIYRLNRKELVQALRRLATIQTERFKGIVFSFSDSSVEMVSRSPETGEGKEVVSLAVERQAEELPGETGFNAPYLLEPLNALDSEEVILEFDQAGKPWRLRSPDDPG